MGIFSDLVFGQQPKPRITKDEFLKVRGTLSSTYHFTTKELDEVEGIFRGDMEEQRDIDKGIDVTELVKGIQYMRAHVNLHHISLEKINAIEIVMMKYIGSSY